jgi:hypothetical protein
MVAAMVAVEIERPARGTPQRGMARRYPPLLASEASQTEASCRLFGDVILRPVIARHRGELLRYVLRSLYGSDYRRRGAVLLGVSRDDLSGMLCHGSRVSRRRVQRLEDALDQRIRNRRKELRRIAVAVEAAFAAEYTALGELDAVVAELNRLASQAMRSTERPIDGRTGRFVSRKNVKFPMLREPLK